MITKNNLAIKWTKKQASWMTTRLHNLLEAAQENWPDGLDVPKDWEREIRVVRGIHHKVATRETISLTAEEREILWGLAYNMLSSSQNRWLQDPVDALGHCLEVLWVEE